MGAIDDHRISATYLAVLTQYWRVADRRIRCAMHARRAVKTDRRWRT